MALIGGGVAVWFGLELGGRSGHDDGHGEEGLRIESGDPGLAGRAAPQTEDKASDVAASPSMDDASARRWELDLRVDQFNGPLSYGFGKDLDDHPLPESSRFAGTKWRVLLVRGRARRELRTATLDTQGVAIVPLPELAELTPLERSVSALIVEPVESGLRFAPRPPYPGKVRIGRRCGIVVRPETNPVVMRLIVPVLPDNLVTGRVVDAAGTPVKGAHVRCWGDGNAGEACTDDDGGFAFHVSKSGSFDLYIWATGLRHVSREDQRLPADVETDLGTFTLAAEYPHAGRVRYADGEPVAGVGVTCTFFSRHRGSRMPPMVTCADQSSSASARTDAKGEFRIMVADASWWVSAELPGPASAKNRKGDGLLGSVRGAVLDHEFEVTAHRLRLRVLDEGGEPVPGVRIEARGWKLDADVEAKPAWTERVSTSREGRADLFVPHGSRWQLSFIHSGAAPHSEIITAPAQGNESAHLITLAPLALDSGIRVALTAPDGTALMPAVLKITTEAKAEIWSRRIEANGFQLALAPGTYNVRVQPIESTKRGIMTHRWMPVTQTVTVAEGAVTDVRGVPTPAAHLALVFRGKPENEDERFGMNHPEVRLVHRESGRSIRTWLWRWEWDKPAFVDEDLEAGAWDLRVELDGFDVYEAGITMKAGEVGTHDVQVRQK